MALTRRSFLALSALMGVGMAATTAPKPSLADTALTLDYSGVDAHLMDGFYKLVSGRLDTLASYEISGNDASKFRKSGAESEYTWAIKLDGDYPRQTITPLDARITLTFQKALIGDDRRFYDLTVALDDFRICGTRFSEGSENLDSLLVVGYLTKLDALNSDAFSTSLNVEAGISYNVELTISASDGGEVPDGNLVLWFHDIDVAGVDTNTWARSRAEDSDFVESITPISGFSSTVYVNDDTIIAVSSTDGRIYGTQNTEVDSEGDFAIAAHISDGVKFKRMLFHAGTGLLKASPTTLGGISLSKTDETLG